MLLRREPIRPLPGIEAQLFGVSVRCECHALVILYLYSRSAQLTPKVNNKGQTRSPRSNRSRANKSLHRARQQRAPVSLTSDSAYSFFRRSLLFLSVFESLRGFPRFSFGAESLNSALSSSLKRIPLSIPLSLALNPPA